MCLVIFTLVTGNLTQRYTNDTGMASMNASDTLTVNITISRNWCYF